MKTLSIERLRAVIREAIGSERITEAASHDALSDALSDMESAARACRSLSLPGDSGADLKSAREHLTRAMSCVERAIAREFYED